MYAIKRKQSSSPAEKSIPPGFIFFQACESSPCSLKLSSRIPQYQYKYLWKEIHASEVRDPEQAI